MNEKTKIAIVIFIALILLGGVFILRREKQAASPLPETPQFKAIFREKITPTIEVTPTATPTATLKPKPTIAKPKITLTPTLKLSPTATKSGNN